MTFLLLRVSGVTMLDEHLKSSKPTYEDHWSVIRSTAMRQPQMRALRSAPY